MRRYFYDQYVSDKSPLAAEVLVRVRTLYAIEAEIRGHPAEHRRAVRQERSRPIVEALHGWLQDQVKRVSGPSDLAKAMRYAIRHWPGLVVFLDDGRVEMDTNVVERAIRPNTLTRKNALFAGSDGGAKHWALAMTLIQTAKLKRRRPAGVADRRARADRFRPDQGARDTHAVAVELATEPANARPPYGSIGGITSYSDSPSVSVASEAFWRLDGLKLLEIQIADRPQRLGSCGLLQRLRQRVEPSLILGLQLDQLVHRGRPPLGATAMVRRAPEPDTRLTAGASGTIAGLALGVGHRSLTKWLARHPQLSIVTSRNWGQSIKQPRRSAPRRLPKNVKAVIKGMRQAKAYREEKSARYSVLGCFDLRRDKTDILSAHLCVMARDRYFTDERVEAFVLPIYGTTDDAQEAAAVA